MPESTWLLSDATPTTLAQDFAPVPPESLEPYYGPTLLGLGVPSTGRAVVGGGSVAVQGAGVLGAQQSAAGGGSVAIVGAGDLDVPVVAAGGSGIALVGGGAAVLPLDVDGGSVLAIAGGGSIDLPIDLDGGGTIGLLGGGSAARAAAPQSNASGVGLFGLVGYRSGRSAIDELASLVTQGGGVVTIAGGGECACGRVARGAGALRLVGGGDSDTHRTDDELVLAVVSSLMAA